MVDTITLPAAGDSFLFFSFPFLPIDLTFFPPFFVSGGYDETWTIDKNYLFFWNRVTWEFGCEFTNKKKLPPFFFCSGHFERSIHFFLLSSFPTAPYNLLFLFFLSLYDVEILKTPSFFTFLYLYSFFVCLLAVTLFLVSGD